MSSCFTACGQGKVEQADTACVFRSSSSDSIRPQVYYRRAFGAGAATFSQMPFVLGPLHVAVPLPSSLSLPFSPPPQVRLAWGLWDHQSSEGRTSRGGVGVGMAPRHPTPPPQDPSSCSSFRSGVLTPSVGLCIPMAPTALCSH